MRRLVLLLPLCAASCQISQLAIAPPIPEDATKKDDPTQMIVTPTDTTAPVVGTGIIASAVTATTLTLTWGAASDDTSAAAALQYQVVRASAVADIDTVAEVQVLAIGAFTANQTTIDVSGLTPETPYAFAVIVKDEKGNLALYAPIAVTTLAPAFVDTTPPVLGVAISFSAITKTGVTVQWGTASDATSVSAALQYKLVRATTISAIDSLAKVAAITGPDLLLDFTASTTNMAVTGLASLTTYAFAVVVKDEAGNTALYAPASVTTLDASAPTPGTGVVASAVTTTGMTLTWGAGSDDVSAPAALTYKVVRAPTLAEIDTIAEVDAITTVPGLVKAFTANLTSTAVTALTPSTSYAFVVVIKDEVGNEALYSPIVQPTLDVVAPTLGTAISFSGIMASGVTVNWGAATDDFSAQATLRYKVVRAATTGAIDSLPEVAAITTSGAGLVVDYTVNITSQAVTGLSPSTTYAFAVVVEDEAGNKRLYPPALTATADTSAPVPGTAIVASAITTTSLTLTWGQATDDVTAQGSLLYKVVKATTAAAIDTSAEADAIVGPNMLANYTAALTTVNDSGLTSSTTYHYSVVVKDAAGNKALYGPKSVTTTDITAPTVSGVVGFSNIAISSMSVNWAAASDDVTAQAALKYKVVRADTAAEIDSLTEVDAITAGVGLVKDFTANIGTAVASGLSVSTTYAFAVVVKDAAGNEALYAPQTQATGPCDAPNTVCGSLCVDTASDAGFCGGCSTACAATKACAASTCVGSANLGISATWSRNGDGDLLVTTPNGFTISLSNQGPNAGTDGGQMDLDATSGKGPENIFWATADAPPDGTYVVCFQTTNFTPAVAALPNTVDVTISVRKPSQPPLTASTTFAAPTTASALCNDTLDSYVMTFSMP